MWETQGLSSATLSWNGSAYVIAAVVELTVHNCPKGPNLLPIRDGNVSASSTHNISRLTLVSKRFMGSLKKKFS